MYKPVQQHLLRECQEREREIWKIDLSVWATAGV